MSDQVSFISKAVPALN